MLSKSINELLSIRNAIATMAAEIYQYDWSADFCKKYVKEITNRYKSDFVTFSLHGINETEACSLGFFQWDDTMWLIPLWILPFLREDEWVFCIDGTYRKIGDADNDNRFGMLAYGIIPNPG